MSEARKPSKPHPRAEWFRNLGFGLFIHWGPFSVLGRGEWSIADERIPPEEYDKIDAEFRAEHYDPEQWVELAKASQMKYLTLTACHGNGYCLFNTSTYHRNAVSGSPKRDLVDAFVKACRRHGMGVGLYYSMTNWYEFFKRFGGYRVVSNPRANATSRPAWDDLIQMKFSQIRELLLNYSPDILWLDDMPKIPESYDADGLYRMIREVSPDCLVGENTRNCGNGDFDISEERFLDHIPERPWEVCMPLATRWSYQATDTNFKSVQTLLGMLRRCMLWGGNFLLNTGPLPDGRMQPCQETVLRQLGDWLSKYEHTIRGCKPLDPGHLEWGEIVTWDGKDKVYLHVDRWFGKSWSFCGLKNKVLRARVLGVETNVTYRQVEPDRLIFETLPESPPDPFCNIIELTIDGKPQLEPWLSF